LSFFALAEFRGACSGCCGKPSLLRQLYTSKISLARYDVDAARVASELSTILAHDVLARMESVGTLPRLVDGLPVRKILVIYNPHSGKNKAGKVLCSCLNAVLWNHALPLLTAV
jgi:hypothetical protein